ncbi:hypothetical protein WJX72_007271 [[Myrmecia] bisecta]|uniref:BTB domain-containing protein n=1 Tax=[Myrmecia] bisecta TaxID=41462 RepID=A0AAW1PX96_9CHLO
MTGKLGFAFDNPEFSDVALAVIRVKSTAEQQQETAPLTRAAKRAKTAQSSRDTHHTVAYQLHVSRLTLAGASEVFKRKLLGWKPAPGEPLIVEILPGEEARFKQLIKFLYTEEVESTEGR